jgi:hypothetical protein
MRRNSDLSVIAAINAVGGEAEFDKRIAAAEQVFSAVHPSDIDRLVATHGRTAVLVAATTLARHASGPLSRERALDAVAAHVELARLKGDRDFMDRYVRGAAPERDRMAVVHQRAFPSELDPRPEPETLDISVKDL